MDPVNTGIRLVGLVALYAMARHENDEASGSWPGRVALVIISPMALALIQHAILRSPLLRVVRSYWPLF
jgi:hypothetical protein